MKIRYRTMTLPVSIPASVALVGTGFVVAPVADGAVVPAISDGQTATPTVIGQVPATFTGQMTVTNDIVTTSPGRGEVNSTTSYNLQLKLQEVSSLGGTFYQWNLVVPSSTWHTTYNETSTDNDPQCIQHGVADTGGNFDNPPDSMLMRQLDNGQGPDIETVTPFFEVQGTSTCESGGTPSEQAGSSCQHQDDTPPSPADRERTAWYRRWTAD